MSFSWSSFVFIVWCIISGTIVLGLIVMCILIEIEDRQKRRDPR